MNSQHRFRVLIFSLRVSPFLVSKWDKQRRRKRHMKHVGARQEAKLKHFPSQDSLLWFVTLLNNECSRQNFRGEIARRVLSTTRSQKGNFALCLHEVAYVRTFLLVFRLREINTRGDFEHNCLEKALISRSHNQFWRRRERARGKEADLL